MIELILREYYTNDTILMVDDFQFIIDSKALIILVPVDHFPRNSQKTSFLSFSPFLQAPRKTLPSDHHTIVKSQQKRHRTLQV